MTKKELKKAMIEEMEGYISCCNNMWQDYLDSHFEDKSAERCADAFRHSAFTTVHLMKNLGIIKEDEHDAMITDIVSRTCNYKW